MNNAPISHESERVLPVPLNFGTIQVVARILSDKKDEILSLILLSKLGFEASWCQAENFAQSGNIWVLKVVTIHSGGLSSVTVNYISSNAQLGVKPCFWSPRSLPAVP